MAQKAHEREAMAEEFSRLDAELKQLQHEFADTRSLNDELAKAIIEKVSGTLYEWIDLNFDLVFITYVIGGGIVGKG